MVKVKIQDSDLVITFPPYPNNIPIAVNQVYRN